MAGCALGDLPRELQNPSMVSIQRVSWKDHPRLESRRIPARTKASLLREMSAKAVAIRASLTVP